MEGERQPRWVPQGQFAPQVSPNDHFFNLLMQSMICTYYITSSIIQLSFEIYIDKNKLFRKAFLSEKKTTTTGSLKIRNNCNYKLDYT